MSLAMNLPAEILEQELITDEAQDPITDPNSPLAVRTYLFRVRAAEREIERLTELKKTVTAKYDLRVGKLAEDMEFCRQQIFNFITQINGGQKVSFPDAGTAYLTTVKEKVEIENQQALEEHIKEASAYDQLLKKPALDPTKAKGWALEQVKSTGELPVGCKYIPESKTLTIRKP